MAAETKRKEKKSKRAEELLEGLLIDKSVIVETGKELGVGSYGRVVELKMNRVTCAGKKLNSESFKSVRQSDVLERFADECINLSSLRHPNIVQFLGLVIEDDSTTIMMVTEILPFSLFKCLSLYPSIPLRLKNTILLDIGLGLVYLHSKGILHRDLSSNNVLLTCALQAKIADFGIAKVLTSTKEYTMTALQGTADFMPPEATMANEQGFVVYDYKADIFSLGHMVLHTVVQQLFPLPPRMKLVPPNRTVLMVSEIERRKELIDRMGEGHHLRDLACLCLRDNPAERPTSIQVVDVLEEFCKQMKSDRPNTLELLRRIAELEAPAKNDAVATRDLGGGHVLAAEPAAVIPLARIQTLKEDDTYEKLMPASILPTRDLKTDQGTRVAIAVSAVEMLSNPAANSGTGSGARVWTKGRVIHDVMPEATSELESSNLYFNVLKWKPNNPYSVVNRGQARGALALVTAPAGGLQRVTMKGISKQPLTKDGAEANSFCKPQCSSPRADRDTPAVALQKGPGYLRRQSHMCTRKPHEAVAPEYPGTHPVPKPRRRIENRDL